MIITGFIFCFLVSCGCVLLLKNKAGNKILRSFSIVIACRNEEKNISGLIENLKNIDYPLDKFEVIIIDDASSDSTWKLLQENIQNLANFRIYRIEQKSQEYRGKKAALKLAAEKAEYDFLLFTDADCRLPSLLLQSYSKLIYQNTSAVIGWYKTQNCSKLQRIIDLSSAAIFALTTRIGLPFSASGMNWVLNKSDFQAVGGYEKIKNKIAGDDKLLLLLIKKTGNKISFNYKFPVTTILQDSKNNQRLFRKYGKFVSSPPSIKAAVIILALFYLYLPVITCRQGIAPLVTYAAGLYLCWLAIVIRFKNKMYLSDAFWLIILPYILLYFTIKGSLGNWVWKGQKKTD
jgi:poly-beta-1,6-N-acetyl-D-glucosamine synthase